MSPSLKFTSVKLRLWYGISFVLITIIIFLCLVDASAYVRCEHREICEFLELSCIYESTNNKITGVKHSEFVSITACYLLSFFQVLRYKNLSKEDLNLSPKLIPFFLQKWITSDNEKFFLALREKQGPPLAIIISQYTSSIIIS